jgi:hypothetical protein
VCRQLKHDALHPDKKHIFKFAEFHDANSLKDSRLRGCVSRAVPLPNAPFGKRAVKDDANLYFILM